MDPTTEETLASLEAQVAVFRMALRAYARAHPDPAALLAAWREVRAEDALDQYTTHVPHRRTPMVGERIQAFAEDWTAELVDNTVAKAQG